MGFLSSLMVGLLLFGGIITGLSLFYGDLISTSNLSLYGYDSSQISEIQAEDLSSMSSVNSIIESSNNVQETLNRQSIQPGILDPALAFITVGFDAANIMFNMFPLFGNVLTDSIRIIGLPTWIFSVVMGVVVIIAIFLLISAKVKWDI